LKIRRTAWFDHHSVDRFRPGSIIANEAEDRGLPLAGFASGSVQPAHEAVQDEEWRLSVLHLVLAESRFQSEIA